MHKVEPETGRPPPEAYVWSVCVAAILVPIGIFWFSLTGDPSRVSSWVPALLAGIPFGCGNTLVFIHGTNYLLNAYSVYAASAAAGNTVARSLLGAVLPLVAPKMYYSLGPAVAGCVCGAIATALIPIPWIFYKYGSHIRKRSPLLIALAKQRQEWEK
jgi:hypothetical protein